MGNKSVPVCSVSVLSVYFYYYTVALLRHVCHVKYSEIYVCIDSRCYINTYTFALLLLCYKLPWEMCKRYMKFALSRVCGVYVPHTNMCTHTHVAHT